MVVEHILTQQSPRYCKDGILTIRDKKRIII